MATITTASASPVTIPASASNLSKLIPCPYTYVATKVKQNRTHNDSYSENPQRAVVPRVCRLRRNDNAMAIYAVVDPIDTGMIASDVCVNMLVEQLSQISFDDDLYKKKIVDNIQQVFYETENRLLQMTFDRAQEKAISGSLGNGTVEKCLPSMDEAQSGAFLFAAAVTQSKVYVAYTGTIRAFLVSNNNVDLYLPSNRPQYYHTGSLHTIDNEDESLRLKNLNVNLDQVRIDGLDNNHSKYTRCIGKLTEKLLSSTAAANDVNEARCNALICEPKFEKFPICSQDYAFIMMTDKLYQMYLKTGISEDEIPSNFIGLFRESLNAPNPAQRILNEIEDRFHVANDSTTVAATAATNDISFQDLGLLIHFFHHSKSSTQASPFPIRQNTGGRVVDGEVTVDEVKNYIIKNAEMQEKREKNRSSSKHIEHILEKQTHNNTKPIEPFIRFDDYEKLLNDNEQLRQADSFITKLLYSKSAAVMDEELTKYLESHPSLQFD